MRPLPAAGLMSMIGAAAGLLLDAPVGLWAAAGTLGTALLLLDAVMDRDLPGAERVRIVCAALALLCGAATFWLHGTHAAVPPVGIPAFVLLCFAAMFAELFGELGKLRRAVRRAQGG